MRTDHLDVVQFHGSPSREELEAGGAIEELRAQQQAGTVRFIGMSGTIPNLADHITMGVFDEFQIPYSALQREHEALIGVAVAAGAGTLIRGGVARGGPAEDKRWDVRRLPEVEPERPRALWEAAGLDALLDGMSRMEFMLRFTLTSPDVHTTIVGTAVPAHLAANIEAVRRGPLPSDLFDEARRRLDAAER
jgi:aryl-alcohol dehydrogenase-like predicted oxidoreductase